MKPLDDFEDDFEIVVHTIEATGKKLRARWTVESARDITSFHGYLHLRNRRPESVEESNSLFMLASKFSELYPPGTIVHINEAKLLGFPLAEPGIPVPVKVMSDAVVLLDKCSVAFLCSESKDESDFYFVDDLIEYEQGKLDVE